MKDKSSQQLVPTLPSKRPVDWVDVDGVPLRRFTSGTEAGDFLGVSGSSISQCIRGKTKSAGGASIRIVGIDPEPFPDQIPLSDLKNVVYAGMTTGLKKAFFSDPIFLEKARQAAEQAQSQSQKPNIPIGKSPGGKTTNIPKDSLQNLGGSTTGGDTEATPLGIGNSKMAEIKKRGPKSTAEVLSSALAASMMKKPESPSPSTIHKASSIHEAPAINRAPSPVVVQVGKELKTAATKPSAVHGASGISTFLSHHPHDQSLAAKFLPKPSNNLNSNLISNLNANTSNYHGDIKSVKVNSLKSDDFTNHIPDFDIQLASINRLIKMHTPENTTVSKEARAAFSRAAGLFIFYLTHCANDICKENKRKTILASDIALALSELEFGELIEPMEKMLEVRRLKESTSGKSRGKSKAKKEEGEEDEGDDDGVPDGDESTERAMKMDTTSTDAGAADDRDTTMDVEKTLEESDGDEQDDDAEASASDGGRSAIEDGDGDDDVDGMNLQQQDGLYDQYSDDEVDEDDGEENDLEGEDNDDDEDDSGSPKGN